MKTYIILLLQQANKGANQIAHSGVSNMFKIIFFKYGMLV